MDSMDAIALYNVLKKGKTGFLDSLDSKITELNESKPSYYKIGKEIVDRLKSKLNISEDRDFKVGDKIIMNELANQQYGVTHEGSEGEIIDYDSADDKYEVKFTKLTGGTLEGDSKDYDISQDHMDKIGSNLLEDLLSNLKEDREFKEGDKVILGDINEDNKFTRIYQKERNENYPRGTKGIVYDPYGECQIYVRFSKKGEWSREWNNIIKDGNQIAMYRANELIPAQINEEDYSRFIDEISKHAEESLINEIKTEVEPKYDFEAYEKKKEELIKKNIPLMKAYGLFEEEIKEYFTNKKLM